MLDRTPHAGAPCCCWLCNERNTARGTCGRIIAPAVRQALADFDLRPNFNKLADQCFVSPAHFRRLTTQVLGGAFTATVWRYRVLCAYYSILFEGYSLRKAAQANGLRGPRDLVRRAHSALRLPEEWLVRPSAVVTGPPPPTLAWRRRKIWRITSLFAPLAGLMHAVDKAAHLLAQPSAREFTHFVYDDPTREGALRSDVAMGIDEPEFPKAAQLGVAVTPDECGISLTHPGPIDLVDMAYREAAVRGAHLGAVKIDAAFSLPLRVEVGVGRAAKCRVFLPVGQSG